MKTMQGRGFLTTAIAFLLALLLLGAALQGTVRNFLVSSAFDTLDKNTQVLSELAAAHYANGTMSAGEFYINLDVLARVSDTDVFICDSSGYIRQLFGESSGDYHGAAITFTYRIPATGTFHYTGTFRQIYSEPRYICARSVLGQDGRTVVGYVVASVPVRDTTVALHRLFNVFISGAIGITLLCLILMHTVFRRQSLPLQEMAQKARAFGHGDLDARVQINGDESREVAELALAFNNMASSLQKSEYSRQEFVANVSHELKTPMTTIGGYVDGILDGTIPPEKAQYYMQIVSQETKRLSRLVRSMLDISQLQTQGGIPAEQMTRFDVGECAGRMLLTFEQKINGKSIDVHVDMPQCPVYTVAQEDYISQVIYNLLDNAVKFCPQGGRLSLKIREGDSKIYVSVGNDGQTIPPEELPLVFDRFHKTDKSRAQNRDSWGLGLYIVKTIVGLHGEDISVTSTDGFTEFTFTLPSMS